MTNAIGILLLSLGIWLIIDGVGSIIKYKAQSPIEQLIRIIRCGVGTILISIVLFAFK